MSRDPYQRLPDGPRGTPPPRSSGGGLFDRRSNQLPPQQRQGYPSPPPPSSRGAGYEQYDQRRGNIFQVGKAPSADATFTNFLYVSPNDFQRHIGYVIVNDTYVFSVCPDSRIAARTIGPNLYQREWGQWSLGSEVTVTDYHPDREGIPFLGSIDLEISLTNMNRRVEIEIDSDKLADFFVERFESQIFTESQILAIDFRSVQMKCLVKKIETVEISMTEKPRRGPGPVQIRGMITRQTAVVFRQGPGAMIPMKASSKRPPPNAIIRPDFKFEEMGIGGLDSEFATIFRRAFASRIFPAGLIEKLGIQHVRGILLYGPPGTGKTLMARQIGKMLKAREPKIVNGPEILNKFVGQSEENIRKLFADAEKEYKEKGDQSDLHIIIFDELDAITKQRGTTGGGTGVADTVVNQLLSKMDGVDQLNNILIIGMTNRFDMIDEALLRPGRLEVHMEINLPDQSGRLQILKIHTQKMRDNNIMGQDVDLNELAALTKNYSGAEIAGLIKSATSFAFNRHTKAGTVAEFKPDAGDMKVNRADFMMALDETHPAFGVSEEELAALVQGNLIMYSKHINGILKTAKLYVEQVRTSDRTRLLSVLLHGPTGSGKTALAAQVAMESEFPYVKLISPESLVGLNEPAKVQSIIKVFNDAYKSPSSIIVVDNIERLVDWTAMGARFSNQLLQTLVVLFRKRAPKNRRLLVIATTSERTIMKQMGVITDAEIAVPAVSRLEDLDAILKEATVFEDQTRQAVLQQVYKRTGTEEVKVGIKNILNILDTSQAEEDNAPNIFVDLLSDLIVENTYVPQDQEQALQ